MVVENRAAWRETAAHVTTPPKVPQDGTRRISLWQCPTCLRANRLLDAECAKCGRGKP